MAPACNLCFDLNLTVKLKKINLQGHGPAEHDQIMRVIWKKAIMQTGVGGPKSQIKFKVIRLKMMGWSK